MVSGSPPQGYFHFASSGKTRRCKHLSLTVNHRSKTNESMTTLFRVSSFIPGINPPPNTATPLLETSHCTLSPCSALLKIHFSPGQLSPFFFFFFFCCNEKIAAKKRQSLPVPCTWAFGSPLARAWMQGMVLRAPSQAQEGGQSVM